MMLRLVTEPKFYFEEKPLENIKRQKIKENIKRQKIKENIKRQKIKENIKRALEKILRTKREMHAHVEYKVEQTKRFFFLLRTMPEQYLRKRVIFGSKMLLFKKSH